MRFGLPTDMRVGGWKVGWQPLWCVLIVLMFSALAMGLYLRGPLGGDFDKHFMPAERWGVPPELAARGLGFLYRGANESGWDGQFYYYIANDLTDNRHTRAYLDADAYRYQRIGLPLLAKAASMLLLQDWVSPAMYYGVSLALVLLATFVSAAFLRARGVSPYWSLVWALALGTQITLLNGLPDAAADALLLMALVAYLSGRGAVYLPLVALSALAREGYVLFPAVILAVEAWWVLSHRRWRMPDLIGLGLWALPLLVFGVWHLFIRLHFTQTPAQQAHGILGPFMESTLRHAWAGLSGAYPNTPTGRLSRNAGLGLVAYMALLGTSLAVLLSGLRATLFPLARRQGVESGEPMSEPSRRALAVALATLVMVGLYACFGDTVIWNFTGYMKAANVLLLLVPLLLAAWARPMPRAFAVVALFCLVFFDYQGYKLRVDAGPITYPQDMRCGHIIFQAGGTCGELFVWAAAKLPGAPKTQKGHRVVGPGARSGPVMYGPYIDMPTGRYRVQLDYASTGYGGRWELGSFGNGAFVAVANGTLAPAGDEGLNEIVQIPAGGLSKAEFRVHHGGTGVLTLKRLVIERLAQEAPGQ